MESRLELNRPKRAKHFFPGFLLMAILVLSSLALPNAAKAQAPAAPTGLTATAGAGQVALAWNAVSGTYIQYSVYRGTSPGQENATAIQTYLSNPNWTDTGVTGGVTYYYTVTVSSYGGPQSAYSNEASGTPTASLPAVPSGVGAAPGDGQVSISWTTVTGAASYNVKRSATSGGPYTTLSSPTASPYTDTTVTNGTTYYYVVSAVNTAGESGNSGEVSAMPQPIPVIPTGVSAAAGNLQISMSWTASPGATSYSIWRGAAAGGEGNTAYSTVNNGNGFTDTGLQSGATYYYQVSASNSTGSSVRSAEVSATPYGAPPAVTGLTAAGGNRQAALNWATTPGATTYSIYRGLSAGAEGATPVQAGVNVSNFTDANLSGGVTYYYRVAAVNSYGTGPYSAEVSAPVTGVPNAPTNPSTTAGDGQASLAWTGAPGSASYFIKRALVSGGPYTQVATSTSAAVIDGDLTNNVTYYYVISAHNFYGESGNSAEVSVTPQPAPAPPGGFTASASDGQIRLYWTASPTATTYKLKRFNTGATAFTTVTLNGSTAYMDTTVTDGTTYFYVVTASNSSGESPSSMEVAATPYGPGTVGSSGTGPPQNYPYVQYQTAQMAAVSNLLLSSIFLPKTTQIQWYYNRPGFPFHYEWKRTANPGTTPSTDGHGSVWGEGVVDSFDFSYGAHYTYSVQVIPDGGIIWTTQVMNGNSTYVGTTYTASSYVTMIAAPLQALATDDQAVDSRYDLRYGNPTFLDHNFGTTTFRGGLFTGFSMDPARAGRSFLKFSIPTLAPGQNLWAGSINSYFTGSLTTSTGTGWSVGCQSVSSGWSVPSVVWSAAPFLNPASATSATKLLYDTGNPATYWASWPDLQDIGSAAATGQPLSVGLADTAEAANQQNGVSSWSYFAKSEFDSTLAPSVVYALGAPLMPRSVTCGSGVVQGGGSYTATVLLNSPAPAGGTTVTLTSSNPAVASVPSSLSILAGSLSATFTVTTAAVGTNTSVILSATDNLMASGAITVTP